MSTTTKQAKQKTHSRVMAQAIWDMSDRLTATAEEAMRAEGWTVKSHYDGASWFMGVERFVEDQLGLQREDHEVTHRASVHIGINGKTEITCNDATNPEDLPPVFMLLIEAMKPLGGPFLVANAEW